MNKLFNIFYLILLSTIYPQSQIENILDGDYNTNINFDDIKEVVISEYKKRQDDKALRDYLENLKLWYDVERNI